MAKKQIEELVVEEVVATVEEVVNESPVLVDDKYPGHNTRAFRQ